MRRTPILIVTLWALLPYTASASQGPASDADAHIATARAAAGQDYRATFMNLCLPSASTGGGRAAAPAGSPFHTCCHRQRSGSSG